MPNFIEHLGVSFLADTNKKATALFDYIEQEGTAITGYYGIPYLNMHFGNVQLILHTVRKDPEIIVFGSHATGNSIWEVCLSGTNIIYSDVMERRCVVSRASDGGGMAVVNIVNADVLPSFDDGETVKLQMIAFPSVIDYFKDEAEYAAAQPESRNGNKWLLADGAMMPVGLMRNRSPEIDAFEMDEDLDDLMLIRGTVKKLYHGVFELDDEEHNTYIRCIIETELGELEIVHTINDVEEEHRDNICIGSIVSGLFILSGDAAIEEYENGFVLDEANNLSILRSTFAGADPERIRYVFAEDATYLTEYNNATYTGRNAIIDRLTYVMEEPTRKCFAHLATITAVAEGEEQLPYAVGQRCIVLAYDSEHDYETIAFIELNGDGRISKLTTSHNTRYRFRIDKKAKPKTPFADIQLPDSIIEAIVLRAKLYRIIDNDITEESILSDTIDVSMYEHYTNLMLSAIPEFYEGQNLKHLFGYMFAKAIETAYSKKKQAGSSGNQLIVRYTPDDAWRGTIKTPLNPEEHEKIVDAMDLGMQFAKDFAFFHPFDSPHNDAYDTDLLKALLVVQQLGQLFEPKCMQ